MKVSFLAKPGDLIYALPAIKALARLNGGKVTLVLSALSFQVVPLIQQQPYIENIEILYDIACGAVMEVYNIDYRILKPEDGINLTIGPRLNDFSTYTPWTEFYIKLAGVEVIKKDGFVLPTLWNHRQWFYGHTLNAEGRKPYAPPKTVVFAPESETFTKLTPLSYYADLAASLKDFSVIVAGCFPDDTSWPPNVVDLRGRTTLTSLAYTMAEARAFVGALSAPFHLARHAGTPPFIFQVHYHPASMPVDTPYRFYVPDRWREMANEIRQIAESDTVTLWPKGELEAIWSQ